MCLHPASSQVRGESWGSQSTRTRWITGELGEFAMRPWHVLVDIWVVSTRIDDSETGHHVSASGNKHEWVEMAIGRLSRQGVGS